MIDRVRGNSDGNAFLSSSRSENVRKTILLLSQGGNAKAWITSCAEGKIRGSGFFKRPLSKEGCPIVVPDRELRSVLMQAIGNRDV